MWLWMVCKKKKHVKGGEVSHKVRKDGEDDVAA